jgi:Rrf2 family protein
VTRRAAYSVLAVLNLGHHFGEGLRKSREIAEETHVPVKFLRVLLADLVREGLVASVAGRKGGYALSRPPEELTLLEVIEAAGGSLQPTGCDLCAGGCGWEGPCPLRDAWARGREALAAEFASISFLELEIRGRSLRAGPRPVGVGSPTPQPFHRNQL